MDAIDFCFNLALFAAAAYGCYRLAVATDRWVRSPLLIYLGIYGITTLIGGVWMCATDGAVLADLNWGVDLSVLSDLGSSRYWALLFSPLIVPAITMVLLRPFRCESLLAALLQSVAQQVSPLALLGVAVPFFAYCLLRLAMADCLFNFLHWFQADGDYMGMILMREATSTLGSAFFGVAYILLPTLSFVALYQYRTYKTWDWLVLLVVIVAGTVFIDLELMQKAPVLLYLLFLGVGLIELRVLAWRSFAWMLPALVLAITLTQSLVLEQWTWRNSVQLLVFRMSHSFPYYVNLYPDVMPFAGVESGLHLAGIGSPATDSWDVFNYMYPQVTWAQGAAPAAAHVRAYSQAGTWYAMVTLAFIGVAIKAAGGIRVRMNGPISFALYMQLLVFLYYVTQTSLREALISCYGIFWAFVALMPLVLLQAGKSCRNSSLPRLATSCGSKSLVSATVRRKAA